MKKRLISIGVAVCVLFSAITVVNTGFAEEESGYCGENVQWNYDAESGKLSIFGFGDMAEYTAKENIPWHDKAVKSVEIGEQITYISSYAFADCAELTQLQIPANVTAIGSSIINSSGITQITITHDILSAGNGNAGAFDGNNLTQIIFDDNVTIVPDYICNNAYSLTNVMFGSKIEYIGSCAFSGCSKLENISIPESLVAIGTSVFADTPIKEITFNSDFSVNTGNSSQQYFFFGVLAGSSVTDVTFGEKVTSVASNIFDNAQNVKNVNVLNPDCVITDDEKTIPLSTTIYCYSGSPAENYAVKYNREYRLLCSNHIFADTITEPLCEVQGYTTHTCTNCGYTYVDTYLSPTGHTFIWVITKQPTNKDSGEKAFMCSVCEKVHSVQTIPALTTQTNHRKPVIAQTTTRRKLPVAPIVVPTIPAAAYMDVNYLTLHAVPGDGCLKVSVSLDKRLSGYIVRVKASGKNEKFKDAAKIENGKKHNYVIVDDLKFDTLYYVQVIGYVEKNGKTYNCNASPIYVVKTK